MAYTPQHVLEQYRHQTKGAGRTIPPAYFKKYATPPDLMCLGGCGDKAPNVEIYKKWQSLFLCNSCQKAEELSDAIAYRNRSRSKEALTQKAIQAGLTPEEVKLRVQGVHLEWEADSKSWAYVWGPCGTGKTSSLIMWTKAAIYRGWSAKYTTEAAFLAGFRPPRPQYTLTDFIRPSFLAFDEIGQHSLTDWGADKIRDLVDARYRNRKLTAFSSNISLDDLSRGPLGDRVVSRIVEMAGPSRIVSPRYDFRLKRKV